LSDHHPLLYTAFVLFTKFDLFAAFSIDRTVFVTLVLRLEELYLDNPYHNRTHAAEVTMATAFLACQGDILDQLADYEVLALMFAR